MDDKSRSSHKMVAAAAAIPPQSEVSFGREVSALTKSTSVASTLDDIEVPQAISEVGDKQEWKIDHIISKEDLDGVVRYMVRWIPTVYLNITSRMQGY
jgi:hypothetical protein